MATRLPLRSLVILASSLALLAGCAKDKCEEEVPSFQLDVSAPSDTIAVQIRSLTVSVIVGAERFRRTFDISTEFQDGTASVGIKVEPPPTGTFSVQIDVSATGSGGAILAEGGGSFSGSPDGCNQFVVSLLEKAGGQDAGVQDSGVREDAGFMDMGVVDTGVVDTGVDAGTLDAAPMDAEPMDGAPVDAAPMDAAPMDAAPMDAAPMDAAPMDADVDAGPVDMGFPDQGFPDAGFPDQGFPDQGFPDAGFVDTGVADAGFPDTGGCVPAAEIVADGIDQDCDGVDSCYQDSDNDNFGTTTVVDDTDLDCTNNSALTSNVNTDCNDGTALIYPGAPEIVADGIDQDCNTVDRCYQDSDDDGFGSTVQVNDTDLDCNNASALTSSLDTDCDDANVNLFPSMPCDDGDACTQNDSCVPYGCFGYGEVGSNCGCVAGCPSAGNCCEETCTGGACSTCSQTAACDYLCSGDQTCSATCQSGSVCHLRHEGPTPAAAPVTTNLTCQSGASCELDCRRNDGSQPMNCTLDCAAGAICYLDRCQSGATCTLVCAAGAQTCPGGRQVCNRPCP